MRVDFDLSHVRAAGESTILPPGEYDVTIRNAELRQTKDGENYINIAYQVDGPTHMGAVIFEPLHLWSGSEVRTEISLSHLKSIRGACGLNAEVGGDTDELIGKRIRIRVAIREYNGDQYQSYKKYRPCVTAAAAAAAAPSAPVPPASSAAAAQAPAGAPW